MSEASVIQVLTLNQASTFTTTTGVNRVKIHNDSSFYLRVYFGLGAPSRPDSGGWHDTISPGASPVIAVVGAATGPVGRDLTNSLTTGTYQGQIVVFPFLPVGAPGPNGVVTGASLCYLTGYYPDEYAETAGQVEAYVQAAKQGRYQSVLGGSSVAIGNAIGNGLASGTQLGNPITLSSTTMPNLYTANAAGASLIQAYVYGFSMQVYVDLAFGSTDPILWEGFFSIVVTGAAFAPVRASREFWHGMFYLQQPAFGGPVERHIPINVGPAPINIPLSLAQGALVSGDKVFMAYNVVSETGEGNSQWRGFTNGYFVIDTVNQTPLYAFPFPASPPWSPSNPQTY